MGRSTASATVDVTQGAERVRRDIDKFIVSAVVPPPADAVRLTGLYCLVRTADGAPPRHTAAHVLLAHRQAVPPAVTRA